MKTQSKLPIADASSIRKILIVDLNYLGDILVASGAIRELKLQRPDLDIDVLCLKQCEPLVRANRYVSGVFTSKTIFPIFEALKARKRGYDLVTQVNTAFLWNIILLIAGKKRLGYCRGIKGTFLTHKLPILINTGRMGNRTEEIFYLFQSAFNLQRVDEIKMEYDFPKPTEATQKKILIFPIPAHDLEKRCWDKWSSLTDELINKYNYPIEFNGTKKQRNQVNAIIEGMVNQSLATNHCGEYDIDGLIRHVQATAKVIISVNSFPMHIGILLGVPTVAIISGTPHDVIIPRWCKTVAYIQDQALKNWSPRTGRYGTPQINTISVTEVMDKINELGVTWKQ
jgi:ADP-heptose:LPS heptosyltransferase